MAKSFVDGYLPIRPFIFQDIGEPDPTVGITDFPDGTMKVQRLADERVIISFRIAGAWVVEKAYAFMLLSGTPASPSPGQLRYDSIDRNMQMWDGLQWRGALHLGNEPYAYALGGGPTLAHGSSYTLAANGGSLFIPFKNTSLLRVQSYSFYTHDADGLTRSYEATIGNDRLGNSASLPKFKDSEFDIPSTNFTPAAAGMITNNVTTPGTILTPGNWFLCIRNTHATQDMTIAYTPAGPLANTTCHYEVEATSFASVAALGTLNNIGLATKLTHVFSVRINGRMFAQTSAY